MIYRAYAIWDVIQRSDPWIYIQSYEGYDYEYKQDSIVAHYLYSNRVCLFCGEYFQKNFEQAKSKTILATDHLEEYIDWLKTGNNEHFKCSITNYRDYLYRLSYIFK